jgi:crotonobetainyl-CoA:carnitine CoA-transferase CaiB-like acyl-CoA transferase
VIDPRGQAIFKRLIEHYDIVVENFVPGTLEKWGLGYADLAAVNARVILVRVTGFGQTGPYARRKSFDRLGIAMGGLTYTTGYTDRPPVRPGYMVADYGTGLMSAFATLVAVYNRDVVGTGQGQEVDVTLFETIFRLSGPLIANYDKLGIVRERSNNLVPGIAPGDQFETSDGRWVVIHAGADHHFRALMRVVGHPEIADDPQFATLQQRIPHMEFLNSLVGAWVARHTCEEAMAAVLAADVAIAPVYSARDIAEDPHYAARESIVTVADPVVGPVKQPAPTPKLSRTPGRVYRPAPAPGEHNAAIYGGLLGMSRDEIARLEEAGVI